MKEFLNKLSTLGIKTKVGDGFNDAGVIYEHTIHFPEVAQSGMFLLGKIIGNEFVLHQRIGMEGINWRFGNFQNIDEEKLKFLSEEYFKMKKIIDES